MRQAGHSDKILWRFQVFFYEHVSEPAIFFTLFSSSPSFPELLPLRQVGQLLLRDDALVVRADGPGGRLRRGEGLLLWGRRGQLRTKYIGKVI